MTSKEVLDRIRDELDQYAAELKAIDENAELSVDQKKEERKKVKAARNRTVIDAWLPVDDAASENRAKMAAITITNDNYLDLGNGSYLDVVEAASRRVRIVKKPKGGKLPALDSNVHQGFDFVGRLCDNLGMKLPDKLEISVHGECERGSNVPITKNGARIDIILLARDDPNLGGGAGNAAHEMTHYMEANAPGLVAKLESFYQEITTNPTTGKQYPKKQIKGISGEMCRESNIPIPVPEDEEPETKVRIAEYTMRDYGDKTLHELLSMFVQAVYTDSYYVVSEYPEFFERIMKCLK